MPGKSSKAQSELLGEAAGVLRQTLAEMEELTKGYVARVLVQEHTSCKEASALRRWRRLGVPTPGDELLDDINITSRPRLVVTGDAGSGKSYILRHAYLEAVHEFLSSPHAPFPCFLDLERHLTTPGSLEDALDQRYEGLFSKLGPDHHPGCVLFLDALDDRLRTERNPFDFLNGLGSFVHRHSGQLRSVALACRRARWNPGWLTTSLRKWQVYSSDCLDHQDYREIIPGEQALLGFFQQAEELGIQDLLRLPFIGFDLARKHMQGLTLPLDRQQWFREQIRTSLQGTTRDQARGQAPPVDTLIDLSRQLACLAAFGPASAWTAQEAVDQLGQSQVLRSREGTHSCEQIHTLFERPLFSKIGERFSFSHQLFPEYLAAAALCPLPLRKQRQLLETPFPSLGHRIVTAHRGVAILLAQMSPKFRDHLIKHDPLLAFLAELPGLSSEADEQLTRVVIDEAIVTNRAYWWGIAPGGERPSDALARHRPRDIDAFVRPYLERCDEMALLWGTECAVAWGGSPDLNSLLTDLARHDGLHVEIRKNAVQAVLASEEAQSIQSLYDLLDSEDDQVRGHALRAYRITEVPTPADYISKLHGGAHDDSLDCLLQTEARSFGLSLDAQGLREAFREVASHLDELGNLGPHLLHGLLLRATQLQFEEIPPALFIRLWLTHDSGQVFYERELKELTSISPGLLPTIWNHVMDELGREDCELYYWEVEDHLAPICDDRIFDLLPSDDSALTRPQRELIVGVLRRHFNKEPTSERLNQFQEKAPAFTAHFRLSRPSQQPAPRDPFETRAMIAPILSRNVLHSWVRTFQVLTAIETLHHGVSRVQADPDEVIQFLKDLSAPLFRRVLELFGEFVLETHYIRERTDDGKLSITRPQCAVPFWVLWRQGFRFPTQKIEEMIRCYGFMNTPSGAGSESCIRLLDELEHLDPARWTNTVLWLADSPDTNTYEVVEYLIAHDSDIYLERCRDRLRQCDFNLVGFSSLVDYWVSRRPPDFEEILRACYGCADRRDRRMAILLTLLSGDNDWAWDELASLIEADNPPLKVALLSPYRPLRLPTNSTRLGVLADWYACLRRDPGRANWPDHLAPAALEAIVNTGGNDAIAELRRLQEQEAFPDAKWLSHTILRIEDRMLGVPGDLMEPGKLLDFVNRDALGVVLNERDLFEWVCEAIESVKHRLETEGVQVHGYWNRRNDKWEPKSEPECQNVFWPSVQDRLVNLGIVGVQEKPIAAGKADFWVEKPVRQGQPLRTIIELKVARKAYGRKKLVEPLETQLWQNYIKPSGCKHGIYIVLWFRDSKRYPHPSTWTTPEALVKELRCRAEKIEQQHRVDLACYVVDLTTPARSH